MLRAVYPDLLQWSWNLPDPYKWNVWLSLDDGESYILVDGYWMYGDSRQFAPDGGSELHFIVGVDEDGNEITARSNAAASGCGPCRCCGRFILICSSGIGSCRIPTNGMSG